MKPNPVCSINDIPTWSRLRAALARPDISFGKYSVRIAKLSTVAAPAAAINDHGR
jgi:hypothetical protein